MATFPDNVVFGRVIGRYIIAVADTTADADHNPDATPAVGTVTFTPTSIASYSTGTPPATVVRTPIVCTFDSNGDVTDPTGYTGAWLVAGTYTVSFKITGIILSGFTIVVTAAHTAATPLDLTLAAPLMPTPLTVFVVNQQVYLDTLAARDAALAAAIGSVPLRSTPPDHTVVVAYVDTSTAPPVLKGWDPVSSTWVALGGTAAPTTPDNAFVTDTGDFLVTDTGDYLIAA